MDQQPKPSAPDPIRSQQELLEEMGGQLIRLDRRIRVLIPILTDLRDLARVLVWLMLTGYAGTALWLLVRLIWR